MTEIRACRSLHLSSRLPPLPPFTESAIVFAKRLFASTRTYSDQKLCWAPNGARPSLSQIPQLKVSVLIWGGEEGGAPSTTATRSSAGPPTGLDPHCRRSLSSR